MILKARIAQRKHSMCSFTVVAALQTRCKEGVLSIPPFFGHTRCMVKPTHSLVPSWWTLGGHRPHIHQNTYPPIDPLDASSSFETNVSRWSTHPQSSSRLALYGVPLQNIPTLLNAFTSAVKAKELSSPELEEYYTLSRLAHVQSHDNKREIDIIYTNPSPHGSLTLLHTATVQHPIQNDGPHHTTRTSCRSLVLTRRILNCTENESKSDHARRTHEF